MSLFEPVTPKKACQIYKSWDVTTSSMILGFHDHLDNIDLSTQLDNFFIPNAYNQRNLTYQESHVPPLVVEGVLSLGC